MNNPEHQLATLKSDKGEPLKPHDWNFDSIPDHHLIACCYWEYARESTFLKKFKSRCVEANRNPQPLSQAFDLVGKDARTVLSIGTVANSFLLGFGFDPLRLRISDLGLRISPLPHVTM